MPRITTHAIVSALAGKWANMSEQKEEKELFPKAFSNVMRS